MKKNRLAVVGPSDSVKLVCEVAKELNTVLQVFPVIYQNAAEVPEILKRYDKEVDLWLFSGKAPYWYAVNCQNTQKPLYFIPHTGSSLFRVLIQMSKNENLTLNNISFDSFSKKEIEEAFSDISPDIPNYYLLDYDGVISADAVTQYHYDLWKQKKTQVAITCFLSSYLSLKELGIPAYRIWPTRDNIRTMLTIATSKAEANHFKDSQIAIQHISIEGYADFVRESASTYAAKRVESKLYELLLSYTEAVEGSIVQHGNGQYTLYSTRGRIEQLTNQFTVLPILDEITCKMTVSVNGGIGFGSTAHMADENAHLALGLARRAGKSKWMVVLDDKTVFGPLNSANYLQYALRTDDLVMRSLANKLKISVTTVNRILAACDKLDQESISAEDIASYLAITSRSARRLLSSMVDQDLAIMTGEEAVGQGRPRKLYHLYLHKIIPKSTS